LQGRVRKRVNSALDRFAPLEVDGMTEIYDLDGARVQASQNLLAHLLARVKHDSFWPKTSVTDLLVVQVNHNPAELLQDSGTFSRFQSFPADQQVCQRSQIAVVSDDAMIRIVFESLVDVSNVWMVHLPDDVNLGFDALRSAPLFFDAPACAI